LDQPQNQHSARPWKLPGFLDRKIRKLCLRSRAEGPRLGPASPPSQLAESPPLVPRRVTPPQDGVGQLAGCISSPLRKTLKEDPGGPLPPAQGSPILPIPAFTAHLYLWMWPHGGGA
jgi:hypothetical protein